jgi:hypothetical protein
MQRLISVSTPHPMPDSTKEHPSDDAEIYFVQFCSISQGGNINSSNIQAF